MKKKKVENSENIAAHSGTLYVVATPIGNLEDITLRALRILKDVDLIAAEEPDHTRRLCSHYGIRTRLTGYNQHNSASKGNKLLGVLKAGMDIALVTSAGTPAISDPGSLLINMAHEQGIRVSPIPGPSALATALSACGLKVDRFVFLGFLPNRQGKRRNYLKELLNEQRTMILYEAPHRIVELMTDLKEIFGDRQAAVLRELTKVYEEIKRGSISEILNDMDEKRIKGEFTIILTGSEEDDAPGMELKERIEELLNGESTGAKEIATRLSGELDVNYRVVYKECLNVMKARAHKKIIQI
jgi:16S rRNA (cytidine1402-2'-O)-methyltransferase